MGSDHGVYAVKLSFFGSSKKESAVTSLDTNDFQGLDLLIEYSMLATIGIAVFLLRLFAEFRIPELTFCRPIPPESGHQRRRVYVG